MRCTSCGQEIGGDERFCGNCGSPCPVVPPPPPAKPAATRGLDPRFGNAEREFFALRSKLARGAITRSEFEVALDELVLQDSQGHYWTLGEESGKWYVHDGRGWVEAEPPASEPSPAPRPGAERVRMTSDAASVAGAPPRQQAGVADAYRFAGPQRRLGAVLVDGMLLGVVNTALLTALATGMEVTDLGSFGGDPEMVIALGASALLVLMDALYYAGFWAWHGQTPGKMLLGLRIVRTNGQPLSFGRALLRFVGYLISGIALGLGYLWIVVDGRKQGWHDKIAGTFVVRA